MSPTGDPAAQARAAALLEELSQSLVRVSLGESGAPDAGVRLRDEGGRHWKVIWGPRTGYLIVPLEK